jgi:hypothetical protein
MNGSSAGALRIADTMLAEEEGRQAHPGQATLTAFISLRVLAFFTKA